MECPTRLKSNKKFSNVYDQVDTLFVLNPI